MNPELEAVLAKIRRAELPTFMDLPIDHAHVRGVNFGDTLLHIVAVWGDVESARVLLDAGVEIDLPGEHNYTALHEAVGQGHVEMVRLLLARGADPYKVNDLECDAFGQAEISPEMIAILEEWRKGR